MATRVTTRGAGHEEHTGRSGRQHASPLVDVHRRHRPEQVSWYQANPTTSLELIETIGVDRSCPGSSQGRRGARSSAGRRRRHGRRHRHHGGASTDCRLPVCHCFVRPSLSPWFGSTTVPAAGPAAEVEAEGRRLRARPGDRLITYTTWPPRDSGLSGVSGAAIVIVRAKRCPTTPEQSR